MKKKRRANRPVIQRRTEPPYPVYSLRTPTERQRGEKAKRILPKKGAYSQEKTPRHTRTKRIAIQKKTEKKKEINRQTGTEL